jgi:hypothetical protein|tara:strand:- start:948 stop:1139 length:192 start_codon:yes stop_codon:yes gene_type:complete
MTDRWMNKTQAADYLGLCVKTLNKILDFTPGIQIKEIVSQEKTQLLILKSSLDDAPSFFTSPH